MFRAMNAPKVVVFDLGKVLVDFDYGILARRLAAKCQQANPAQIQKHLDHSPLLFQYETGKLTREQFFAEVKSLLGYHGDIEAFAEIFADIFSPMPRMIELHAALRARGVPTFIFSNTNDIAVAHIQRKFPFFSQFDGYVLSYKHGAMKPQARLYEVVEEVTESKQHEIIYLDDRAENIAAGAARGWQVVLQEDPERSWAAIQQTGLLNGAE